MSRAPRTVSLLLLLLSALHAGLPDSATAQNREFRGVLKSASADAIVVEGRGASLRFQRSTRSAVEGKEGWSALAAGDRVLVQWTLDEGPREAIRVIVLPAR